MSILFLLFMGLPLFADPLTQLKNSGIKFTAQYRGVSPRLILEDSEPVEFKIPPDSVGTALILPKSLTERMQELQSRNGAVVCDCSLFVQLASNVLRSRENSRPGVILPADQNPADIIACACGRDLAYIGLKNLKAHIKLQQTTFSAKGHWLIPIGRGKLLGILGDGPVIGSLEDWKAWMEDGLNEEFEAKLSCEGALDKKSLQWAEIQLVHKLQDEGELHRWTLHTFPKNAASRPRAAAVRRFLQARGVAPP